MPMHRCVKLSPFSRWIIMQLLRRTCSESGTRCCQDRVDSITATGEHRALRERLNFFATVCFVKKIKQEFLFQRISRLFLPQTRRNTILVCFLHSCRGPVLGRLLRRERLLDWNKSGEEALYFLPLNRRGGLVSGFRARKCWSFVFKKKAQLSRFFITRRACFPINSPSSPPSATPLLSSEGARRCFVYINFIKHGEKFFHCDKLESKWSTTSHSLARRVARKSILAHLSLSPLGVFIV